MQATQSNIFFNNSYECYRFHHITFLRTLRKIYQILLSHDRKTKILAQLCMHNHLRNFSRILGGACKKINVIAKVFFVKYEGFLRFCRTINFVLTFCDNST
jgi:hypothetical protein